MKKYIFIVLIVASLGSCKDYLEEKQVSTLTQDYYKTESGLDAFVKGLYVYARVKNEWSENGGRLVEPETDAYQTSAPTTARIGSADYASDVSTIANNVTNYIGSANANNAPMGAYPHINNCNIALDILDNEKPGKFGTDAAYNSARKSEVLFLRAWAFYLISNQLGDVPLLLTPRREDNGIYYYPKAKLEDIYKRIIADVRYAYQNLPATQSEQGRVTKWAAGHFLAKLYLNRAQAANFQGSSEQHLQMLYKGNVPTDLDSVISVSSEVITGAGGTGALATDYWSLFDPAVAEGTAVSKEVLWAAQFDINTSFNGRFGNRNVNYHIGDYTNQSGVTRVMAYGRPFGLFKPTDWAYDNFRDKVNDSRYYKTFSHEYISNMPAATSTSFTWSAAAAAYWNANKPAGEPAVKANDKRILNGKRAIIYIENQKSEALDSAKVRGLPYQLIVRWIVSAKTGRYYYRLFIDGTDQGLATTRIAPYLSSKKFVDPQRGGSTAEANFNSEAGTRDFILMRLAETYLIRAEAYGRKGNYSAAVADINVLRNRAAYKAGENRPANLVEWEPKAVALAASEKIAPYPAVNSYSKIQVTENYFTPGAPEAIAEQYIPTVTSKADMFIHFIYNEKAREFLSESLAWEDQHNAGILYERVIYLNQMASPLTGLWPVAYNKANGNGQDGNGKGVYKKSNTFRMWPNAYTSLLTDENGIPLDAGARQAYQNPGY